MTDGNRNDDDGATNNALAKRAQSDILLPEILAAVKQEGAKVDVNVLLVQISEKSQNPTEVVQFSEQILDIAKKFEDHRVEAFKKMANAVIDVKLRDPDEVEKRRNNGIRRKLKVVIAGCGIASVLGSLGVGLAGGSLLVAVIIGTVGMMCLAMLGPLASGESVSSNDMVRMFSAWASVLRGVNQRHPQDEQEERRRKRK